MRTYADTRYRTKYGKKWSMSWKIMGTNFDGKEWRPDKVRLEFKGSVFYEEDEWAWFLNGERISSHAPFALHQKTGEKQTRYYLRKIWSETFLDIDMAAHIYDRFLKKDFDDLVMMELL